MTIRITGMNSGLDTEAIISELVSAQSYKKQTYVKQQTKLSWKQTAWKTLNSKIFSFHQKTLSAMRFSDAYQKKKTTVSNPSAVSVISSSKAIDGVQTIKVNKLAKSGYLTGAELKDANGNKASYTSSTKLSDIAGSGVNEGDTLSFSLTTNGKKTDITLNGSSTIQNVVDQLKSAGINANFDATNQRIFLSASTTGEAADFALTANDTNGFNTLTALGINVLDKASKAQYQYYADLTADEKQALIDVEVAKRTANMEAAVEKADKTIAESDDSIAAFLADDTKPDLGLTGTEDSTALASMKELLQEERDRLAEAKDGETDDEKQEREAKVAELDKKLSALATYTGYVTDKEKAQLTKDDANDWLANDSEKIKQSVTAELDGKIAMANSALSGTGYSTEATRIEGEDAEIVLNKATFTSSSNTFSINELTITAQEVTDKEVTMTTATDYDGIYDQVKSFLKSYNELINEISTMYGADSADKYEPLTSEEKKEMSDDEIEEWEKKIKDSLLRNDETLGNIQSVMSQYMQKGVEINGKTYYLSSFGINTAGYFDSTYKDRYALHIDGDKDDEYSAANDDKLKTMIAQDPNLVSSFFQKLTNDLYSEMQKLMSKTELSSAMTFYNDVELKKEYDNYSDMISKQEDKIKDLEDKWYDKFSAMETALAKLSSKSSAISGLLGM